MEAVRRAEIYFYLNGPIFGIISSMSIENLSGDGAGGTTEGAAEAVGSRAGSFTVGTEAGSSIGGG